MNWEGQEVVVNDVSAFKGMTWEEYLDLMLEKTTEDETLLVGIVDEDPDDEHYGRIHICKCSMEWRDGTIERMEKSLRKMFGELRALSKYWKELHDEDIDEEELLKDKDAYEAWKKYLKPLPDVEMIEAAARERVGGGIYAYGVLYRARRVCHLYALGALDSIVAQEERNLAQAYAIHRCCNSLEPVDKVEADWLHSEAEEDEQ